MFRKIYLLIEKPLVVVSSFASILSIVLLCFNNLLASFIAVCCLCIGLAILLYALLQAIFKYTKQANVSEVRRIATFIDYKTLNAEIIEFQTYRVIQVKTPVLKSYDIAYCWTGDRPATATSDLQDFRVLASNADDPRGYTKARLTLNTPKLYNETAVFHYRVNANDSDHMSKTKVELKIDEPIEFVSVNISLGYKPDNYAVAAKVERSKIRHNEPPAYEEIDLIPFDATLKEYTYSLHHPEPGYFYRISWQR